MELVVGVLIYKLAVLGVALAFGYFGYRLFLSSIWGDSGSLEANYKENKLLLTGAAPGTFFAVMGAIIACITVVKGFEIDRDMGAPSVARPEFPRLEATE